MPNKEIISTDKITAGNAPLSQAVRHGDVVYVQGCTGRHPTDNSVGADIKEQTRYALQRISAILEAAGSSLGQVMTNTCYVTNRDDLAGFNEVYAEFFPADRPARTTIIVNFGAPDNLVEITSTAAVPD
jgi:2-iminobutanoate/2-iminopropanoate deaminase